MLQLLRADSAGDVSSTRRIRRSSASTHATASVSVFFTHTTSRSYATRKSPLAAMTRYLPRWATVRGVLRVIFRLLFGVRCCRRQRRPIRPSAGAVRLFSLGSAGLDRGRNIQNALDAGAANDGFKLGVGDELRFRQGERRLRRGSQRAGKGGGILAGGGSRGPPGREEPA